MLKIKCPKCGMLIGGIFVDYILLRSDRRKCPGCGSWMKLEFFSRLLCGFVLAAIFAAVLIFLMSTAEGLWWLNLLIAFVVLWGLNPVLVRVLGRWKVFERVEMGVKARIWTVIIRGSLLILAISLCIGIFRFARAYAEYLQGVFDLEGGSDAGGREGRFSFVPVESLVSFGVAFVALLVNFFARMIQQRVLLGEKQQSLESNLENLVE